MSETVNTKSVPRRKLGFRSMDDVLAEVDRVVEADGAGTLRVTGNWTAGQIMQHVAKLIEFALDGFPFSAPWVFRRMGRLMKRMALSKPLPAGMQLRGGSTALLPDDDVSVAAGAERLRAAIGRLGRGERMRQASPIFGPLTHEEWTTLQLKHAEHHFGFLDYPRDE